MDLRSSFSALLLVGFIVPLSTAAQAASTSAHAMVVSGQAHGGVGAFGCATSGPQAMEGHWFGSASVDLPTEGYASCNLSGGIQNTSNPGGPSFAAQDVSHAFNGGVNTLSAAAKAGFDKLGVKTTGSFTGETNSFAFHDGEAAAYSTDTLLLPGSGAGTIQFGFSIDGSTMSVGNGETFIYLNYELGTGPIFTAFNAKTSYGTSHVTNPTTGSPVAGFTTTGASLGGSGIAYSFAHPITLGASFDLSLGLFAASYPGAFTGVANNDFFSTARISSIALLDAAGHPIDFSIKGASGTVYDATGAHLPTAVGVPEPGTWAMMLLGFGGLGAVLRRRHKMMAYPIASSSR